MTTRATVPEPLELSEPQAQDKDTEPRKVYQKPELKDLGLLRLVTRFSF
jgi:hypothetical protein